MAYTVLPTVSPGDTIASATWGNIVKANIEAIKAPPTDHYTVNEASDYTTTSASFTDIDATDLALTITTTGGDVMIGFHGGFDCSAGANVYVDVDLDGTRIGGDDGIHAAAVNATDFYGRISFVWLVTSLSAGSHTFKLQWKTSAGTVKMFAGAGTANADVHPQFWVREVS